MNGAAMDRLQAMQIFVRVVESGSFSAVARETNTTQSAVSKQVAGLERRLGARLLSRTTRSLALTEDGERYFERARRLVAEVAEAEDAVRAGAQQLRGWLRVAASVTYGRFKLMSQVQDFLAQHPQVRIDLRLNDGFVDLVEQGIDVAVRVGNLPDSSLVARRIGTARRRLVAHRSLVRQLERRGPRPPRHPSELSRHNCLVYTELLTGNAWTFVAGPGAREPGGTECVVKVGGNLQSNSGEVIRSAVLSSMGIGYSPDWMFEDEIARGEVLELLPGWQSPPQPIQLTSPPQRAHSAKVQAFAAFLAGSAKASAG